MKFTWGTGIFLFLVVFVIGAVAFIIFASRQQVNLVHKDYYEEGVDYSDQMRVNSRSRSFKEELTTKCTNDFFVIEIDEILAAKIDSGNIYLYRPSDYTKDISTSFKSKPGDTPVRFKFNKNDLLTGRYILKFTWYSEGLKYEIDQTVNIR